MLSHTHPCNLVAKESWADWRRPEFSLRTGAQREEAPAAAHHALKYGAPSGGNLRYYKNFVVCYDARLRNPSWVLEHITHGQPRGVATRYSLSQSRHCAYCID